MMTKLSNLVKDTRGANMVEYIIMVGIVALIAYGGFKIFGEAVTDKVEEQGDAVGQIQGELSN